MKQMMRIVLIATALTLALAATALAYPFPVSEGEQINFDRVYGKTGGGEFIVNNSNGKALFRTFCLETDEYLNLSDSFKVSQITDSAQRGGSNTNSGDPISDQTKWLYWNYSIGNILVFDNLTADAFQAAIWRLEEESFTLRDQYGYTAAQVSALADQLIAMANNALSNSPKIGQVAVINLVNKNNGYAQDLLVAEPVPEPGTILLLGGGLVGLAIFGRKRIRS